MSSENRRSLPVKLREWLALAPISIYEHAVLDALIYHTKYASTGTDALVVWPSRRTIALIAKCSTRKVDSCLASLRKRGYITKVGVTEADVVKYRINLGHYHAPKLRLFKEVGHAAPGAVPPCTPCATPLHDVQQPPAPHANKQDEFEQDEYEQGVVNCATHTATQSEKEGARENKGQKIARVVALAAQHGYALIPMPRLATIYDDATDAGVAKTFAHWQSFKSFAAKQYNCWVWSEHPDRKPESMDLCHTKMPVGIAMRAFVDHKEKYSDDDATFDDADAKF